MGCDHESISACDICCCCSACCSCDEEKNLKEELKKLERLESAYNKATLICFCKPDEYQLHQNNLAKAIAEYLLEPLWKEKGKNRDED